MHTHSRSRGKGILLRLSAFIAALATLLAVSMVAAPAAQATTYVSAVNGYGKLFPKNGGYIFVGEQVIIGKFRGFCTEMNKDRANTDIVGDISTLPGTATVADKLAAINIANRFYVEKLANNVDAYRSGFAIWYLLSSEGKAYFNAMVTSGKLTPADVAAIRALIDKARRSVGGFKIQVTAPAIEVGGSATGNARITNKLTGWYAPKGLRAVVTTSSNNRITSVSGVAGNTGTVTAPPNVPFKYTRVGSSTVTINVTVTQPSSAKTRITFPSSSTRQRLIGSTYTETSRGYATFEKKANGSMYTTTCATNCDGTNVPVTVKVCQAGNSKPVKHAYTNTATGQVVGYLSVASGQCASKTLYLNDSTKIADKYCYTSTVGGACVTGWVAVPGTYTVVCPAWAKAVIEVSANCDSCTAGARFVTPAHPQFGYRWYTGKLYKSSPGQSERLMKNVSLINGTTEWLNLTEKVQVGDTYRTTFLVYTDQGRTQLLQAEKTLVKIQILALGSDTAQVKETMVRSDGSSSSIVKTIAR